MKDFRLYTLRELALITLGSVLLVLCVAVLYVIPFLIAVMLKG